MITTTGKTEEGLAFAVRRSAGAVGYCSLTIRCGTRSESSFPEGIAHFAEHTIFKGTSTRSAVQVGSCLDRLGGELNAYTTKEEIVIHATVLKEDLWKAVDLLLDMAANSIFPAREIETERGVVIDEIKSYKDSPADDIYDSFEEMFFDGCQLGRKILGSVQSVKRITAAQLLQFTKERFVPSNMVLSIVADLPEAVVEKKLQALSAKFFSGREMSLPLDFKTQGGVKVNVFNRVVDKRNHEANAVIGGEAPSLYNQDRIAAVLLANILGGPGSNSLLNRELREKHGWVYGVECGYTQYSDTGIMAISLGCEKSNLEKCLAAVDKILASLRDNLISDAKLKAAKKQLLGQLAISSDNGEAQCLSAGKSLLSFGRVADDQENRKSIECVSAEDLRRLACSIWAPESISKLIFL